MTKSAESPTEAAERFEPQPGRRYRTHGHGLVLFRRCTTRQRASLSEGCASARPHPVSARGATRMR